MLISNDEARKQVFLALYNLTLDIQNKIDRLVTESQHREQELLNCADERIQNLSDVVGVTDNRTNGSLMSMQNQLAKQNEQDEYIIAKLLRYANVLYIFDMFLNVKV